MGNPPEAAPAIRYDALLCPTEPTTAPRVDQETVQFDGVEEPRVATLTRHTRLFNMTGFPTAPPILQSGSTTL